MQWLEPIRIQFATYGYDIIVTVGIAVLAVGLAKGVAWGAARFPQRMSATYRGRIVAAVQILILLCALAGIIVLAGMQAAGILIAAVTVVLSGAVFYRPNLVTDRLAVFQNRRAASGSGDESIITLVNNQGDSENVGAIHDAQHGISPGVDVVASAQVNTTQVLQPSESGLEKHDLTESSSAHTEEAASAVERVQQEALSTQSSDRDDIWFNQAITPLTKRPALGKRTIRDLRF